MPTYTLQYGTGSTKAAAGEFQITGTSASTAVFQCRPNANATWRTITGPTYTAKTGGGGTPDTPADGDTLTMGSGSINGQTFDGTATYSTTRTPNGYYAGASITGGDSDWDAVSGPTKP